MSYLDDELIRIEKYIAGLGIKLRKLTSPNTGSYACWSPNSIDVYTNEHKTKTELILTLVHEVSHQIHWQHNGRPDIPNENMLDEATLNKVQRKRILDYEKPGIELMPTIAIELGLKIPMYKVILASALDLWAYQMFYEVGRYPNKKEKKLKKKELTKLYKGKK